MQGARYQGAGFRVQGIRFEKMPLREYRMGPKLSLILALVSLVLWIVFAFVLPVGIGAIHVLFAIGATLLVRWYALRYA